MKQYLSAALRGALGGAIAIVIALIADLNWECAYRNRGCHDGQGGIVLVVLVPWMFVVGGFLGWFWAWVCSFLSTDSIFASIYLYNGQRNLLNRVVSAALSIGLWCLITTGLFLLLLYLDQF
jgi:hypothetical protein